MTYSNYQMVEKRFLISRQLALTQTLGFIANNNISSLVKNIPESLIEELVPGKEVNIPIQDIIKLQDNNLGEIIPPAWFSLGYLKNVLEEESQTLCLSELPLPFYWHELSTLLIKIRPNNIESLEQVTKMVSKLHYTRTKKINSIVQDILFIKSQEYGTEERDLNFDQIFEDSTICNMTSSDEDSYYAALYVIHPKTMKAMGCKIQY
ncbi:uncharacterized protein PGTG_17034 [Puccinia graminis f. sp. tritici CRL 75-36-700-3]|uniref:DNA replication complex GINS protein PSF2 n=1 Tax=Puccinia graminis f. sp. tritici (strain CRL 75-36-700-3 / race SCCL) TaxID=418459 RepID=E3L2R9_PUCGT|nr:uncharacterized protein PGTG_17034 [Puccinia graminis f. sp. tritici CRL 75-36-700-3]EFP90835.1 hypothetical protein PGTG_17034 [Puccinia graminis f. sp. tritici CRL 75-36-700-3]